MAYLPAMHGGYIWDDYENYVHNPTIREPGGLYHIWFVPGSIWQYYPLTYSSFWAEYALWGESRFGLHFFNVLLHGLTGLGIWRILLRLGVPGAWFASSIFLLHPVHVESVAWISERKNVLSGVLYVTSLLCYLHFLPPEKPTVKWSWSSHAFYGLSLLLFCLALLSKTVTCTLPAVVLLLHWWKAGRVSLVQVAYSLPFWVAGAAMGLVTAWVEKTYGGAAGTEFNRSFWESVLVAGRASWFYLGKLVWPTELTFIYPKWPIRPHELSGYLYPVAMLGLILAFWLARSIVGRGPVVAICFFLGTLFPALGFFTVYFMRYSYVADHFQYLASIGPITLLVAGVAWFVGVFERKLAIRVPVIFVSISLLIGLFSLTYDRAAVFRSEQTVWLDTVEKNPSAFVAQNNLGLEQLRKGNWDQAEDRFQAALTAYPQFPEAHYNMALVWESRGDLLRAITHLEAALQTWPEDEQLTRKWLELKRRVGQ